MKPDREPREQFIVELSQSEKSALVKLCKHRLPFCFLPEAQIGMKIVERMLNQPLKKGGNIPGPIRKQIA